MGKDNEDKTMPDDIEVSETDKLLIEKGYTADELSDLSDAEKDGLLGKDEETGEGDIDDATLESLPVMRSL